MKKAKGFYLVLVTAPNTRSARRLARAALRAKLVACANLVAKIESHYWWQGRLERSGEVLMILKARQEALPALERLILRDHPYQTPEFIVLPLSHGNARYLAWWAEACRR